MRFLCKHTNVNRVKIDKYVFHTHHSAHFACALPRRQFIHNFTHALGHLLPVEKNKQSKTFLTVVLTQSELVVKIPRFQTCGKSESRTEVWRAESHGNSRISWPGF